MKTDFLLAITQLTAEKNLAEDVVFDAVESALAAAYKRELVGVYVARAIRQSINTVPE